MKSYPNMPLQVVAGWPPPSTVPHPARHRADFHYHNLDEWLEVTQGDVTFFTLSGQEHEVVAGQALHIPRGEVHRVEVGSQGVTYQMWLPAAPTGDFQNLIAPKDQPLFEENLALPVRENNVDGKAEAFFKDLLSEQLSFCKANGGVVTKKEFIAAGFTNLGRVSDGTVRVLSRTADSLLLSTVVTVTEGPESGRNKSYTNVRLFKPEGGRMKLRIWVNYPEPAP
jgi:hypothetical protein